MARLLLIFLIVLLPLRGWAAERMVHPAEHGQAVVLMAQADASGMSEDCALHMQQQQMASHHANGDDQNNAHSGCQACQLCMPLAALDSPSTVPAAVLPHGVPVPRIRTLVSADPARHAKPPIS